MALLDSLKKIGSSFITTAKNLSGDSLIESAYNTYKYIKEKNSGAQELYDPKAQERTEEYLKKESEKKPTVLYSGPRKTTTELLRIIPDLKYTTVTPTSKTQEQLSPFARYKIIMDKYTSPLSSTEKKVVDKPIVKESPLTVAKMLTPGLGISPKVDDYGKFLTRTGLLAGGMVSTSFDFFVDALTKRMGQIKAGDTLPSYIKGTGFEAKIGTEKQRQERQKKLEEWNAVFEANKDNLPQEKIKQWFETINSHKAFEPSDEWKNASLSEKFSPEHITETFLELAPSVIASLGMYAINPVFGSAVVAGSTAGDIKDMAEAKGVDPDTATKKGIYAGVLVSLLDRIVPSKILGSAKNKFVSSLTKRLLGIAGSGLTEGGTEVLQEAVTLATEKTFRDDLGWDEAMTRSVMSFAGGLLGGSGMDTVVQYVSHPEMREEFKGFVKQLTPGLTVEDVSKNVSPEIEEFVEKAKKENLTKEEFVEMFNAELVQQNLTKRDTAKRIQEQIKKDVGMTIAEFYDVFVAEKGVKEKEKFSANEKTEADRQMLTNARIGAGEFNPGEIYQQKMPTGILRPVVLTKRNTDGSVDGYYAGAISETEGQFGMSPASLLPAKWNNPSKELSIPEFDQNKFDTYLEKVFKISKPKISGPEKKVFDGTQKQTALEAIKSQKVKTLKSKPLSNVNIINAIGSKKKNIPILSEARVSNGRLQVTDLEVFVDVKSDLKDGMYQVVGKNATKTKLSPEDFPSTPSEETELVATSIDSREFSDIIKKATLNMNEKDNRIELSGININITDGAMTVVSTDAYRLFINKSNVVSADNVDIIVSNPTKLSKVLTAVGDMCSISVGENTIKFSGENGEVIVRRIQGTYPDYKQILRGYKTVEAVDGSRLSSAIKELLPLAKKVVNNNVYIDKKDGELLLSVTVKNNELDIDKTIAIPAVSSSVSTNPGEANNGVLIMPIKVGEERLAFDAKYLGSALKSLDGKKIYVYESEDKLNSPIFITDQRIGEQTTDYETETLTEEVKKKPKKPTIVTAIKEKLPTITARANKATAIKAIKEMPTKKTAETLRGAVGMTVDDIMKTYPDIKLKRDVPATDVYGNKVKIPDGEVLTPYELKGNKVLLQDGETYDISTKKKTQQGIKLTPEIKAKIKGEAPTFKASGKKFADAKQDFIKIKSKSKEKKTTAVKALTEGIPGIRGLRAVGLAPESANVVSSREDVLLRSRIRAMAKSSKISYVAGQAEAKARIVGDAKAENASVDRIKQNIISYIKRNVPSEDQGVFLSDIRKTNTIVAALKILDKADAQAIKSEEVNIKKEIKRREAKNALIGFFKQKELTAVSAKKRVVEYANTYLPISARGKVLSGLSKVNTIKGAIKLFSRIDTLSEKIQFEEAINNLKKTAKNIASSKQIDVEYQKRIQELLDTFELTRHTEAFMDKLRATQAFLDKQSELGHEMKMPNRVLRQLEILGRIPKDQLTLSQLQGIQRQIELLINLGKLNLINRNAIYIQERVLKKQALLETEAPINSRKKFTKEQLANRTKRAWADRYIGLRNYLQKTNVGLTSIDLLAEITGMVPMKETLDADYGNYLNFNIEIVEKFEDIIKRRHLLEDSFENVGIYAISKQEGGMQRLVENNRLSREYIESIKLTEGEMELYNFIVETNAKTYPLIKRWAREEFNVDVKEVKSYMTFFSDFEAMSDFEIQQKFGNDNVLDAAAQRQTKLVEKSFVESRKDVSDMPLRLNAKEVFLRHIDDVAYALSMGRDIKMYSEIVKSKEMKETFQVNNGR